MRRSVPLIAVAVCAALLATLAVCVSVQRHENDQAGARQRADAALVKAELRAATDGPIERLNDLATALWATELPRSATFGTLARRMLVEEPFHAVAYLQHLSGSRTAAFERRYGRLEELSVTGRRRAPPRADYYPATLFAGSALALLRDQVDPVSAFPPVLATLLASGAADSPRATRPLPVPALGTSTVVIVPAGRRGYVVGLMRMTSLAATMRHRLPAACASRCTTARRGSRRRLRRSHGRWRRRSRWPGVTGRSPSDARAPPPRGRWRSP